jgi:hypothetical protein
MESERKDEMGLSIEELELQSAEYLPAREVMTGFGGGPGKTLLGGLVNVGVDVHDVNVFKDIYVLTGKDSDGVDIDHINVIGWSF